MVASSQPVDSEIRRLVAQPTGNWVIRAPAGSGKTTLLVTRYLELLSRVEKPEEILAITFTRKATAEMRERILSSLQRPNSASPSHLVEAAERARKRSLAKGWEIVANPSRLKIQTIESFRRSLVEASPVEAEIAPHTELVAGARDLYQEAITRAFRLVKRGGCDRRLPRRAPGPGRKQPGQGAAATRRHARQARSMEQQALQRRRRWPALAPRAHAWAVVAA